MRNLLLSTCLSVSTVSLLGSWALPANAAQFKWSYTFCSVCFGEQLIEGNFEGELQPDGDTILVTSASNIFFTDLGLPGADPEPIDLPDGVPIPITTVNGADFVVASAQALLQGFQAPGRVSFSGTGLDFGFFDPDAPPNFSDPSQLFFSQFFTITDLDLSDDSIFNPTKVALASFGNGGALAEDFDSSRWEIEVVPTPALLPGLIAMGAAAIRKRNQFDQN